MEAGKGWYIFKVAGQRRGGQAGFFVEGFNSVPRSPDGMLSTAVFFRNWADARRIIAKYPDRSRLSILVGWPYDPPAMDATVFVGYSIEEIPEDLRDLAR